MTGRIPGVIYTYLTATRRGGHEGLTMLDTIKKVLLVIGFLLAGAVFGLLML